MQAARQETPQTPKLIQVLQGKALGRPPMWLMRQAGRYLPEYRELRAKANGFLDLCYRPEWAAEITLQPIRRFGFDAAILFADILIVPDALGQKVAFSRKARGPCSSRCSRPSCSRVLRPEATRRKYGRICETVALVRAGLPPETALIGFCGAPWTVATYMIAGHGSPDQAAARASPPIATRRFCPAARSPRRSSRGVSLGPDRTPAREVVQIFDSWAGVLPRRPTFDRWVIAPTVRIVEGAAGAASRACRSSVFRVARRAMCRSALPRTGVDGLGCDTAMPLAAMRDAAGRARRPGQSRSAAARGRWGADGNRDPARSSAALQDRPHIFNLGHGILPETPIAHVERLVACGDRQGRHVMDHGSRRCTSSPSSPGWRGCSICRGSYVYHADAEKGSIQSETFKIMERRLLPRNHNAGDDRRPGCFGLWLVFGFGSVDWSAGWLYVKVVMVLLLSGFHGVLGRWRQDFADDRNTRPSRFYRAVNEIPTVIC